eukprot:CAMPEP_0173193884 /NCGR_PEP_ID=MMETSP1141-20130122/14204_1 /TAXON_ID=483371 /ORGANISM="non described non described, Strain CCMP2298" /LENGTH=54 /DNA_ID=CAMNT_0014118265 /DNA_START=197 /DNA_END=358 /DNA_ORIENTATION=+
MLHHLHACREGFEGQLGVGEGSQQRVHRGAQQGHSPPLCPPAPATAAATATATA